MTKKPFNTRVQDAIAGGSSATVAGLIREAEDAAEAAVVREAEARQRALDPLLPDSEIEAARRAAEDAGFQRDRLRTLAGFLKDKRDEFAAAEDQADRRILYEQAVKTRDAASGRLRAEYTELANRLGEILEQVLAADEVVARANRNLPEDAPQIISAEQHARPTMPDPLRNREFPYIPNGSSWAMLTQAVRLPALACGRHEPIWGCGTRHGSTIGFTPEHLDEGAPGDAPEAAAVGGKAEAGGGGKSATPSPASISRRDAA